MPGPCQIGTSKPADDHSHDPEDLSYLWRRQAFRIMKVLAKEHEERPGREAGAFFDL
jgi:hypothetical protein